MRLCDPLHHRLFRSAVSFPQCPALKGVAPTQPTQDLTMAMRLLRCPIILLRAVPLTQRCFHLVLMGRLGGRTGRVPEVVLEPLQLLNPTSRPSSLSSPAWNPS